MQNNGKGLSIAALVLGIIATVLAWFYLVNIAALACGIVGIILAVMGKKKAVAAGAPTGIGTAGLVLSINRNLPCRYRFCQLHTLCGLRSRRC